MRRRLFTSMLIAAPASPVFSQAKKGEALLDATGGWIHYFSANTSGRVFNPMGPGDANFPTMTIPGGLGTVIPNAALGSQLKALQSIFQATYPKPQGHSLTYSVKSARLLTTATASTNIEPRWVMLSINSHGLESDGRGGVAPINVAASQGDTRFAGDQPNYDGLVSVMLNDVSPDVSYQFFAK